MEEAFYDRMSFQKFLGFGGVIPDESSICRFRHLLEEHDLSQKKKNRKHSSVRAKDGTSFSCYQTFVEA